MQKSKVQGTQTKKIEKKERKLMNLCVHCFVFRERENELNEADGMREECTFSIAQKKDELSVA